jgi:AraC-like DNA-binding protein
MPAPPTRVSPPLERPSRRRSRQGSLRFVASTTIRRGPSAAHLRAAKDLMDREFGRPLDLDALAREAGYSRFNFARAFRDTYGETPRAYLTRRRIERA